MEKLHFKYCADNYFLTAQALILNFNYAEKNQNPLLLKPRDNMTKSDRNIKSGIGIEAEGVFVDDFLHEMKVFGSETQIRLMNRYYSIVIVDRAHLLTDSQVDLISDIVDKYDISVVCFGQRTDFSGRLYNGSKRLMEVADVIEEVPTVCWCGEQAIFNTRIINGTIVTRNGNSLLNNNEVCISLCRKHYKEGKIR